MPLYYFRIRNGRSAARPISALSLPIVSAAWVEMTKVCGDLIGSISRNLKADAEWQMEFLDECKKPLFQIRLVVETLD
jgi:hypothetical protein